jgi:menaquinone-dependent protoporphyrinogen oxidase
MELSNTTNDINLFPIEETEMIDLQSYEKIILGASIRYGKHSPKVFNFVKKNKGILEKRTTAFFTVNVVARKKEKNTPETNPYMKKFLELSGWVPDKLGVFAGKIDYPKYGFFDRQIIRLIMFITKGPTDTTQTYEFTDWEKVREFSRQLF